jgi:L-lactate dehydrogenase complex protein LldG
MMTSRDNILAKINANQPDLMAHPSDFLNFKTYPDSLQKFKETLHGISGKAIEVHSYQEIIDELKIVFPEIERANTTIPELSAFANSDWAHNYPHTLADVDLLIIKGHFAVAENAAIWITEDIMGQRVAPFINQYLAIVVKKSDMVDTMHQAYDRIGTLEYGFGVFIAGPSKTADIEQSLVLGAHGARGLHVFLID